MSKRLCSRLGALLLGLVLATICYAGLETVVHIQDLNAAWPLGSDLAATGDDHVRNIKSALKTDFPNFNGTYTSAAAPVFAIPSDTDTGIYSLGANDLGIAAGGVNVAGFSGTRIASAVPHQFSVGNASAPGWYFIGDTNTGAYWVGADDLGFTTGGTLRFDISTAAVTSTLPYIAPVGSAGAPSYTFAGDTDSGMFHAGANDVRIAVNGVANLQILTTGVFALVPFSGADGSAAAPQFTFFNDSDTGFYRDTNNQIGIALGGSTAGQIANSSATLTVTGCTTSPTSSTTIRQVGNIVYLKITAVTCTSNANSFTLTGLPTAVRPAATTGLANISRTVDSGTNLFSSEFDVNSSGVITFYTGGSSTGWATSGTKGIPNNVQISFIL